MKALTPASISDYILRAACENWCRCRRLAMKVDRLFMDDSTLKKFSVAADWAQESAARDLVNAIRIRDAEVTSIGLMSPYTHPRGVRFGYWLFIAHDDDTLTAVRINRIEGLVVDKPPAGGGHVVP